jgi:hypothetical protein
MRRSHSMAARGINFADRARTIFRVPLIARAVMIATSAHCFQ